jgi:hypothetical protein
MIYGSTDREQEKMKEAGPPRCPVVHGELPSGPWRITQRSTTNSNTKRSAAAPAAASDGEDETMAEKTKRSTMAAQISTSRSNK